jgi:hypothetical protein
MVDAWSPRSDHGTEKMLDGGLAYHTLRKSPDVRSHPLAVRSAMTVLRPKGDPHVRRHTLEERQRSLELVPVVGGHGEIRGDGAHGEVGVTSPAPPVPEFGPTPGEHLQFSLRPSR